MTPSPPYVSAMLAVHNTNNITTIWEFNTDTGGKGGNNVIWSQSRIYLDHFFLSRIVDNNQAMTYFEYRISNCYIFLFIFLLFFYPQVFPGFQKNFVGDEDIAYDLSIFRSLDYLEVCIIYFYIIINLIYLYQSLISC